MATMKKKKEASKAFVTGVLSGLEARGIEMTVTSPFPLKADECFSAEGAAMTRAGRLDIRVHDNWIATRYALPGEAAKFVNFVNPHSGKWNFHFDSTLFDEDARYVADCVASFLGHIDVVEARKWETVRTEVTFEELSCYGEGHWKRCRGFGEEIVIEGLDREEIADFLSGSWTDVNGERPEWMVSSNRAYLDRADDVELAFHIKAWNERNPDSAYVPGSSPSHAP